MSERAPYSRVYWGIPDDPKFETIFDDDRHLATWLRLLLIADQAHPSSGSLPANARRTSVSALTTAGLIEVTGSRFRVKGLDAERARRASAARAGGLASGRSRSVDQTFPTGSGNERTESNLDETRRDEDKTRRGATNDWDDGRTDLEAFLLVTRRAPTEKQRQLLDNILERRDVSGPQWSADIILRNPTDPIGALIDADKAWRAERIAEAQAAETPKPPTRRRPGLPSSTQDILRQMKELDAIREAS